MYICKTRFSYRYGTYDTEALVKDAVRAGLDTLVLANRNNTADVWQFVKQCELHHIKPIVGATICQGDESLYVLIAKNAAGLLCINDFITYHLQHKAAFPARPVLSEDCYIIYPLSQVNELMKQPLLAHEFIGISIQDTYRLYQYGTLLHKRKIVWTHAVSFATRQDYNIHKLLRAIDHNVLLSKLPLDAVANPSEYFVPMSAIAQALVQYPSILQHTSFITQSCTWQLPLRSSKNKKSFTGDTVADRDMVRRLTYESVSYRYATVDSIVSSRIEKELEIIDRLGFNTYFLIAWDVVQYARHKGFYYVGRGSGANSIVAYCLRITDVDPIELDLYFERFLNPYRTSPPDFDLDFSWQDRDEVIDYIMKRHGTTYTCLLGAYATFQKAALCRELGKVFGLPKDEIDKLSMTAVQHYSADPYHQLIKKYSEAMIDYPDHLSIHAGGILISELPITQYTALELPPKGFPTAQIDMHIAEDIGLDKLDILSQRGLGHIKDAIAIIQQNKGVNVDIHDIKRLKEDPILADNIRRADTIGCFYIESPAMRQLLAKLQCHDYLTLVAASSIIRPGVASSGMMRAYIERHHHPEQVEYLHPKMKELLEETHGVMVYQEDVIKVAHHFGGIDMGEADILRRAMSGKYRGNKEMMRLQHSFFTNCERQGYPYHITAEVWRQIASFAGYSFSKAHSASFAVESYQSLMLKAYFPQEFMVAVINNFGGFYSTELYFHELRRSGATVMLPCVNHSERLTSISGSEVYIGLIHIIGLEDRVIEQILMERATHGPYLHLYDFIQRTRTPREQTNILIRIQALRFTGMSKQALLWEANCFQHQVSQVAVLQSTLFEEVSSPYTLPQLEHKPSTDIRDEIELLGFMIANPYEWLDDDVSKYPLACHMAQHRGKQVVMIGYLVTIKYTKTKQGERMCFGTFIDAAGQWLDTVHFPRVYATYPFSGKGCYKMTGTVIEEFGVYTLSVSYMEKLPLMI